jgi:hypothetical protein
MNTLHTIWQQIDEFWLWCIVITVVPLTWVNVKMMRARRAIRERVASQGGVLLDQADRERELAPDDRGIFAILFTYRDRHGERQRELCELQLWGPPRFRPPDPGDQLPPPAK